MNNEKGSFRLGPVTNSRGYRRGILIGRFSLPIPLSAKQQGMTKSKVCCNASSNNTSTR